jgi:hypothetical protein
MLTSMPSCASCPKTWTGLTTCHCSYCHETFSGIRLFDVHRRYGKCHDPASLRGPLRLVQGVWHEPEMSDEARAQIAR